MPSLRSVLRTAIAIVFCGALLLGLDLLERAAGRDEAIEFSAFLVVILVVGLISMCARRP
jgi:hypothetical protein